MNKQFYVEVFQTRIGREQNIETILWLDSYGNAYLYDKASFYSLEEAVSIHVKMLELQGWKISDMFYVGDDIFMYRNCKYMYRGVLERFRKVSVDES